MKNHIQILPPQEARRIAAGEVVDRPAALIREFLDNAIDSGASVIEISIEGGGSKKAEVSDNGSGMDREDLEKCFLAHATSKIRSLDDLNTAETLGFRGEALAAAVAVAQLEIITSIGSSGEAWRLEAGPGESRPARITGGSRAKGSTVRALNVFDSIPARKRFLKRDGSEASLCRQVFIEKALAFPEITFRFTQDGRPKDFFPAAGSFKERFAAALLDVQEKTFLHELSVSGNGFSAEIVTGGPELYRADRRMLYVFVNGRRILDYSTVHAMEYGMQGWFPNGSHPIGAVYVDIDPALADFNIHPAKREARFRDSGAIHHAVSAGLRDFVRRHGLHEGLNEGLGTRDWGIGKGETGKGVSLYSGALAMEALLDKPPDFARFDYTLPGHAQNASTEAHAAAEGSPVYGEARYAGRVFGLFILIEWGSKLFIIDQHAAHERILYNHFISDTISAQELLVPIFFTTESPEDDVFLEAKREELAALGIAIKKEDADAGSAGWQIEALPAGWKMGDGETVRKILELRSAKENIAERWAATLCCHYAVRDGEHLDEGAALALAKEVLNQNDPRCPHGRPIWTEISREALYKAVRR